MRASGGSTHEQYRSFRRDLAAAGDVEAIIDALFTRLASANGTAAALIETAAAPKGATNRACVRLLASRGPERFWSDYIDLCRARTDLVSRILRLSPHTLALGDIRGHPRLAARATTLVAVLARHRLNNLFAIPAIDRPAPTMMAIVAGRDLVLRRSNRHLLTRMGIDVLARVIAIRADLQREREESERLEAHRLTRRQLEIAHWLVAGKTDWEIGEILQISPKTVNYHVEQMKQRYGVRTRHQFVAAIVHQGGIAPGTGPSAGPSAGPTSNSSCTDPCVRPRTGPCLPV